MATTELNSALKGISGGIDAWVYRNYGGQIVISRRPQYDDNPSVAQQEARSRFKLAAAYAKSVIADPARRAAYAGLAKARNVPLVAVVLTDYLKPPTVGAIDLSGYHGHAGDPILVHATDDVEVTGVAVVVRDAADAVLEQGAATLSAGVWRYVATTTRTAGQDVSVTATATDRPGHTDAKLATWVAP